jgi:hypothetical protein
MELSRRAGLFGDQCPDVIGHAPLECMRS